jgi:hypothetical protein
MNEGKKLRGLLHIEGIDPDPPEHVLTDLAIGLGLGATEQARRWAWMGFALEQEGKLRRPAHRPKQDPKTRKDAIRAFGAWQMCWNLRRILGNPNANIKSRELVRIIRRVEEALAIPTLERLFPERADIDASLSRGKKILGIDDDWNSKVCEELHRTFPKTTS